MASQIRTDSVTYESEISMSVVTNDTTFRPRNRRLVPEFLRRTPSNSDDTSKSSCCGSLVNVEPILLLIAISTGLFSTSQALFTYWARCVEIAAQLYPNEKNVSQLCAQISAVNNTELQDIVEADISSTKIWIQIASSVPTLIMAPLVGTWSDKRGRKFPLLYSMSGFLLYSIFYLIATVTYATSNIYTWFFASEIVLGLSGGVSSMFAIMLAIVTDDCRHQLNSGSTSVPLRIGVASAIQSIGNLLGTLAVSHFAVPAIISITAHAHSYVVCALIQCVFVATSVMYTLLFVRETHKPQQSPEEIAASFGGYVERSRSDPHIQQDTTYINKPKELFCSLKEVLCVSRPGWTRFCLNLSIFLIFVEFLAMDAGLLLLLVKRQPFAWSDKMFSIFSVIRGCFFSAGMVIGPLLLSKINVLGKDSLLILFGSVFSAVSFFMLSFASSTTEIFGTAVMALFVGGLAPGFRSFLPRLVPQEHTARLLSIVGIVLAFCPIFSSLIFNNIFNATMDWWPGFAFLIGGCFQMFAAGIQGFIHRLMSPQWRMEKEIREHRRQLNLDGDQPHITSGTGSSGTDSVSTTAVHADLTEDDRRMLVT